MMKLNERQKRALVRDGYVKLNGLVPAALVKAAVKEILCLLSESNQEGRGSFSDNQWIKEHRAAPIMDLLFKTPPWPIAESLIGPGKIYPAVDGFIYLRFPQREKRQDARNFHVDGVTSPTNGIPAGTVRTQTIKMCVLLSDVPAADHGNFTVCRASHRLLEKHFRERGPETIKNGIPPLGPLRPVQLTGKAGDVVVCHQTLLHDGASNLSPRIRSAVFFNMAHVDHEKNWREALTDIWREWPGLSPYINARKP